MGHENVAIKIQAEKSSVFLKDNEIKILEMLNHFRGGFVRQRRETFDKVLGKKIKNVSNICYIRFYIIRFLSFLYEVL